MDKAALIEQLAAAQHLAATNGESSETCDMCRHDVAIFLPVFVEFAAEWLENDAPWSNIAERWREEMNGD